MTVADLNPPLGELSIEKFQKTRAKNRLEEAEVESPWACTMNQVTRGRGAETPEMT